MEEEKTLTLKSLDKQVREQFAEFSKKIDELKQEKEDLQKEDLKKNA